MNRAASVERKTGETDIVVRLDLDGSGRSDVTTGIGILDHLISQVARHGRIDIMLTARGDLHADEHHTVEDVALCLGRALSQALGERQGIVRMGHGIVPMDEALALVAVDLGGRGHCAFEACFGDVRLGELPTDLLRHFFASLAAEGRLNVHARLLAGTNDHHKAEALFKALGRALDAATRLDPRIAGETPSTKESIEH